MNKSVNYHNYDCNVFFMFLFKMYNYKKDYKKMLPRDLEVFCPPL